MNIRRDNFTQRVAKHWNGLPGKWEFTMDDCMWHLVLWLFCVVIIGKRLDFMILKVFSGLNDSMILLYSLLKKKIEDLNIFQQQLI